MIKSLQRRWRPTDEYDDESRWLDDRDGGNRWRDYGGCLADGVDPELFFPITGRINLVTGNVVDDEPAYPPAEAKKICDRCPVRDVCLARNMDEEFGVYGGTTGYQRKLITKKIRRKHCPGCNSTDVVVSTAGHQEVCLACTLSWDVI